MRASERRGLSDDDLAALRQHGHVETVARRAVVPLDGAAVALVLDGYFRLFRNAAFVRDVTLGLVARGDVLAPNVAFGDRSSESGAEALAGGSLLLVAPAAWHQCAQTEPGLHLRLAVSLGRRITRLQKKLEELSRAGVEGRIAATLLDLADDFGVAGAAGIKLDLPLSQEDLARFAGTTRETCSSTVAAFARRGYVRGGRLRGLTILERDALVALSQARPA